jgi:tRNA U34 5-carboxymethylaminomethyl modifying GTPase MnmE/TrmE
LEAEVKRMFIDENIIDNHEPIISNNRHIGKLKEAKKALLDAIDSCENHSLSIWLKLISAKLGNRLVK